MNSDFSILLAGLSGASSVLPGQSENKSGQKSDSSNFSEILKQHLSSSSDDTSFLRSSSRMKNGLFQPLGGLDLNPLNMASETRLPEFSDLKTDREPIKSSSNDYDQMNRKAEDSRNNEMKTSNAEKSDEDKKASEKSEDRTEKEKVDESEQQKSLSEEGLVDIQAMNAAANLIPAEISENFSPEEIQMISSALENLSEDQLRAINESPEVLKAELQKLLKEMPEGSEKQELLKIVESPEFDNLVKEISGNLLSAHAQVQTIQKHNEELSSVSESINVAAGTSQNDLQMAAESSKETEEKSEFSDTADQSEDSANEKKAALKDAVADSRKEEAKAQALSENQSEPVKLKESLREEFKKLNESSEMSDSPDSQSNAVKTSVETAASNPSANASSGHSAIRSAIEEVAKKLMEFTGEKQVAGKADKAVQAGALNGLEAAKKASAGEGSHNNGSMGNGFSSGSGNAGMSAGNARSSSPATVPNTLFSEMLQKAEYLKTQDGAKILNLELDPEQLGKVEMELTSRDGTVSAKISAESAMAKAKLDELIPQIREQLNNQGVNLGEITVDISSKNPDERNSNQMSGRKSKSSRISGNHSENAEAIIRKNVLPNLRRAALNIKAVDLTV